MSENKREITVNQAAETINDVRRALAGLAAVARHNEAAGDTDVVESHELVELCRPYARAALEAMEGLGEILKADPKRHDMTGGFYNGVNTSVWGIA